MAQKTQQFQSGTILASMKMDISASTVRESVCVFHDTPFDKELVSLEFDPQTRRLDFLFMDETRDLGSLIEDQLAQEIIKVEKVTFFEMDMEEQKAINAFEVPIKTKKKETTEKNPESDELSENFSNKTKI